MVHSTTGFVSRFQTLDVLQSFYIDAHITYRLSTRRRRTTEIETANIFSVDFGNASKQDRN